MSFKDRFNPLCVPVCLNDMWDGMQVMARHRLIMLVLFVLMVLYVVRLVNLRLNVSNAILLSLPAVR